MKATIACCLPLLLTGCALWPAGQVAPPAPAAEEPLVQGPGVRYRCDGGASIRLEIGADAVRLEGLPQGPERLLLDAGGVGPLQRVYSNARLRLELGLGAGGNEAQLRDLQAARSSRCVSD